MNRSWMAWICAGVLGLSVLAILTQRDAAWAQFSKKQSPKKKESTDAPARPTDPKVIELHKEFLEKAKKLADEFEKKKQHDKAREVYEAVLRLVPNYGPAEEAIAKIRETEATTDKKQFVVAANKAWQDTGIVLQEGKPVIIDAKGNWTFKMTHQLGADGIEIPKELRDFNLGALVGVIVTGPDPKDFKPFHIGEHKEFSADRSGRLMLRMYDADPTDNSGQLNVTIQSTFVKSGS